MPGEMFICCQTLCQGWEVWLVILLLTRSAVITEVMLEKLGRKQGNDSLVTDCDASTALVFAVSRREHPRADAIVK